MKITKAPLIFLIVVMPMLAFSSEICLGLFTETPYHARTIDLRQIDFLEALDTSKIQPGKTLRTATIGGRKETYFSDTTSERPIDSIDKQLWDLSRRLGNIEIGIQEVVSKNGTVLAIGPFIVGNKETTPFRDTVLFHLLDSLLERGVDLSEIAGVRERHVHPGTLQGVFSGGDVIGAVNSLKALTSRYGVRIPIQTEIIFGSMRSLIPFAPQVILKLSAKITTLRGESQIRDTVVDGTKTYRLIGR